MQSPLKLTWKKRTEKSALKFSPLGSRALYHNFPHFSMHVVNALGRRLLYWRFIYSHKGARVRRNLRKREPSPYAQAHVSTKSSPPAQDARLSRPDEDRGRAARAVGAAPEGPPSPHSCLDATGSARGTSTVCIAPQKPAAARSAFRFWRGDARPETRRKPGPGLRSKDGWGTP